MKAQAATEAIKQSVKAQAATEAIKQSVKAQAATEAIKQSVKAQAATEAVKQSVKAQAATEAVKQSVKAQAATEAVKQSVKAQAATEAVKQSVKAQAATEAVKQSVKAQAATEAVKQSVKAQAATEAIKQSVKADPSKLTSTAEADRKDQGGLSLGTGTGKGLAKTKIKMRKKSSHNDCFVKLVRCEDDPVLRTLVEHLKKKQKIVSKKSSSLGAEHAQNHKGDDLDCVCVEDEDLPPSAKRSKTKGNSQANGDPDSKYEIMYVPAYAKEKMALSHISGCDPMEKIGSYYGSRTDHKTCGGPTSARPGQKSLSLVVVHPKPGTKIINTSTGRSSKSTLLQKMISDPNTVISNNITRVMTTAGKCELKCGMCSKTFSLARDLINHKRLAHKCTKLMCTACAGEFPSDKALKSHACRAKCRCDICGTICKETRYLAMHKRMAHKKTVGSYMCYVCCFQASSQEELDTHPCGGKPRKTTPPVASSSTVMVYPKWEVSTKSQPSDSSVPKPNIYIDISAKEPATDGEASSSNNGMQFLCEVCLNMYPSRTALESHKCGEQVIVVDPESTKAAPQAPSMADAFMPMGMEVLPEVEQLAKFYSSVVFKD